MISGIVSEMGHVLLVLAVLAAVVRPLFRSWRGLLVAGAMGAIIAVLPMEYSPTFYTRSLLGDLSMLSWLVLANNFVGVVFGVRLVKGGENVALSAIVLALAVLVYAPSLGVANFPDFYESGYQNASVLIAVGVLGAGLALCRCTGSALWIAAALFVYAFRLNESSNFWDCLIDFVGVAICLFTLSKSAILAAVRRRRAEMRNKVVTF